jgi:hypothetical protein
MELKRMVKRRAAPVDRLTLTTEVAADPKLTVVFRHNDARQTLPNGMSYPINRYICCACFMSGVNPESPEQWALAVVKSRVVRTCYVCKTEIPPWTPSPSTPSL